MTDANGNTELPDQKTATLEMIPELEPKAKKRGRPAGTKKKPVSPTAKKATPRPAAPVITANTGGATVVTPINPAHPEHDSPDIKLDKPNSPYRMDNTEKAYDFKDYNPQPTSVRELPWKPGFDHTIVATRLFRHDQIHLLNGGVQCGYWVPVTISGDILGIPFTEMFIDETDPACPFDEFGFFPYGGVVTTAGGKKCREMYLAARPAVARQAERKLRAQLSDKAFNPASIAGNVGSEKIQSQGAASGEAASLFHPSANPSDPYATPVRSSQEMGVKMITSEKFAGLKNK